MDSDLQSAYDTDIIFIMCKTANNSHTSHAFNLRKRFKRDWLDMLATTFGLIIGIVTESNGFFHMHPLIMSAFFPIAMGLFFIIPEATDSAANHESAHPRLYKITHRFEAIAGTFALAVGLGTLIAHLHDLTLIVISGIIVFFVILALFKCLPSHTRHAAKSTSSED